MDNADIEDKYRLEQYKAILSFHHSARIEEFKAAIEFAKLGINLLIISNGGAAVGVLTFLGALARNGNELDIVLRVLTGSLQSFVYGIVFALFTCLLSYVSQVSIAEMDDEQREKKSSAVFYGMFRGAAIITAVASIFFLLQGLYAASEGFSRYFQQSLVG